MFFNIKHIYINIFLFHKYNAYLVPAIIFDAYITCIFIIQVISIIKTSLLLIILLLFYIKKLLM